MVENLAKVTLDEFQKFADLVRRRDGALRNRDSNNPVIILAGGTMTGQALSDVSHPAIGWATASLLVGYMAYKWYEAGRNYKILAAEVEQLESSLGTQ